MNTTGKTILTIEEQNELIRSRPKPGETWIHHHHGRVKIIRPWNEKESVCEMLERPRVGDRAILANALMRRDS